MSVPQLPWYSTLRDKLVPTEQAANYVLIAILIITLFVLWRGGPVGKAAWAVYVISP